MNILKIKFFADFTASGIWVMTDDGENYCLLNTEIDDFEELCEIKLSQGLKNKIEAMNLAYTHFAWESPSEPYDVKLTGNVWDYMSYTISEDFCKEFPHLAKYVEYQEFDENG